MNINLFVDIVSGAGNVLAAILILSMSYPRREKNIPLILIILSLVSWSLGELIDLSTSSSNEIPLFIMFDIATLSFSIGAALLYNRFWAKALALVTVASIANNMVLVTWVSASPAQQYAMGAINNTLYISQIFFIGLSAFTEVIRIRLNRSRNQVNYFTLSRRREQDKN